MLLKMLFWFAGLIWTEPSFVCTETHFHVRNLQPSREYLDDEDASRISDLIDEAAAEFNVSSKLMTVTMFGESRMHSSISNLMQISETWYKNYKGPYYCWFARNNQQASIRCGAFILAKCGQMFKSFEKISLCWRGFHIEDKEAYLERVRKRWSLMDG